MHVQVALPTCDVARMAHKEPGLFLCMDQHAVVEQVKRNYADSTFTLTTNEDKDEYYANYPRSLFDSRL